MKKNLGKILGTYVTTVAAAAGVGAAATDGTTGSIYGLLIPLLGMALNMVVPSSSNLGNFISGVALAYGRGRNADERGDDVFLQ